MHVLILGVSLFLTWFLVEFLSPLFREVAHRCSVAFHADNHEAYDFTTLNGLCFHEVKVRAIVANEVIFRHKLGIDCIPIALLNEEARLKLAAVPISARSR